MPADTRYAVGRGFDPHRTNFRGSFFRLVWSSPCPRWSGYHSKKKTQAMSSASEAVKNPDHCASWKR
uniref:Uncharacterized protein n=1 Tax=Trichogramma kaykai TaxID=54128 RepID=A0ABD2WQK0_9HYME